MSFRRALLVVLLVASQALVAGALVFVLSTTKEQTTAAAQFARAIQRERERFVRESCEDQNGRHNKALHKLDELVASGQRTPAQRAGTAALIRAVVPKRDCGRLVREAVRRR